MDARAVAYGLPLNDRPLDGSSWLYSPYPSFSKTGKLDIIGENRPSSPGAVGLRLPKPNIYMPKTLAETRRGVLEKQ